MIMEHIVITTMCAIINSSDEWVFIDRNKDWNGLTLPGGHLKDSESIFDCVIREIKEETGLTLNNLQFKVKGLSHFFNNFEKERYIVFNFMSSSFIGNLKETCEEGRLFWLKPDTIDVNKLSDGMAERFDLFTDCNYLELFTEWDNIIGRIKTKKQLILNISYEGM
jgi:8-oxo-dGTP diphosphatase